VAPAGDPVAPGSLRDKVIVDDYLVLIPDAADADATERAARDVPVPRGIDIKPALMSPQDEVVAGALTSLTVLGGTLQGGLPEIKRTQRVLSIRVAGSASDPRSVMHTAASCARAAVAASHGWIVDFYTHRLFALPEFEQRRPPNFALSTKELMVVHVGKTKGSSATSWIETAGLVRFGLPELRLEGIPLEMQDDLGDVVLAAAQTLIERGALTRSGMLEIDLPTLMTTPWPDIASRTLSGGGTGKFTFTATWIEAHQRPRRIALEIPGGAASKQARAALAAYLPRDATPETFDALTPEIEAVAQRARDQLAALAAHFEHGIPAQEHLLIKVLLPIDKSGDVSEWLWMDATSFSNGSVEFVVPDHIGSHVPYSAGQGFRLPLPRIVDYIHVRADRTEVGGETNRFPETRPRARMRGKKPASTSADLQQACDGGTLRSCVELGARYVLGIGGAKDPAKAAPLFQRACEGGEVWGCLQLGALYALGDGVVKDAAKAAALFQKACDGGEMAACNVLGMSYVLSQGVAKDSARAAALFQKACDGGHMNGCFQLGRLYLEGDGVGKDAAKARVLLQNACDGGESKACVLAQTLP
jgi:hypothetical protein